jgi:hypothetical protein
MAIYKSLLSELGNETIKPKILLGHSLGRALVVREQQMKHTICACFGNVIAVPFCVIIRRTKLQTSFPNHQHGGNFDE